MHSIKNIESTDYLENMFNYIPMLSDALLVYVLFIDCLDDNYEYSR